MSAAAPPTKAGLSDDKTGSRKGVRFLFQLHIFFLRLRFTKIRRTADGCTEYSRALRDGFPAHKEESAAQRSDILR